MVLEKILESPLYNKEIKPVNLKVNQPVTLLTQLRHLLRASRGKEWMVPLQKHLTTAAPSKQFVAPPMEKLRKAEGSVYPMSLDTCVVFSQAAWRPREGHSGPWRRGVAHGSTGATTYQVGLERTVQA